MSQATISEIDELAVRFFETASLDEPLKPQRVMVYFRTKCWLVGIDFNRPWVCVFQMQPSRINSGPS